MGKATDARGVLVMAVQDLHNGECALVERLPKIRAEVADSAFAAEIAADADRSARQRERLERIADALGEKAEAESNVWLRAILDDADNDIASIAKGRWRDVALVGALRKAKQAERVSYETAIALAARCGMADAAADLTAIRDEEQAADETLARLLAKLTAGE